MTYVAIMAALVMQAAAPASAPSAAAVEIARRVSIPSDIGSQLRASFEQQLRGASMVALRAQHSEAFASAEAAGKAVLQQQIDQVLLPTAIEAAARVYDAHYTPVQLQQLRAFYADPTVVQVMSDQASPAAASRAANSSAGRSFLASPVGRSENHGAAWEAKQAGATAFNTEKPRVIAAIGQAMQDALKVAQP